MFLAVDATTKTASVAIYDNHALKVLNTVNNGYTHSETLLPLIDRSIRSIGKTVSDITAIIVANGPGSFTGIRIALSTVKALAHALSIPIYTASTLQSLAYHGKYFNGLVCPILDARRSQVYSAIYDSEGEAIAAESTYKIEQLCAILLDLLKDNQSVLFVGDGVIVHADYIKDVLAESAVLGNLDLANNCAAGLIDAHMAGKSQCYQYDTVAVNYLRQSQAEREKGIK